MNCKVPAKKLDDIQCYSKLLYGDGQCGWNFKTMLGNQP